MPPVHTPVRADVDGAGVGPAGADDVPLDGDPFVLGTLLQCLDHLRVADHRAVHHLDGGAAAQLAGAVFGGARSVVGTSVTSTAMP